MSDAPKDEISELKKQIESLSQQIRRMGAGSYSHAPGRRRIECYRDDQLKIGMVVAAKITNVWTRVKIIDVAEWREKVQGSCMYAIERVEAAPGGKKPYDLGPKWARDLFPAERADLA